MDGKSPKLLDRVRHAIRTRHYSRRTEEAYVHWIRRSTEPSIAVRGQKRAVTRGFSPRATIGVEWLRASGGA
jgi:hypothetical protein